MKYIAVITDRYYKFRKFHSTINDGRSCIRDNTFSYKGNEYMFFNIHDHDRIRGCTFDEVIVDETIDPSHPKYQYYFKCLIDPVLMMRKK